MAMTILDFGIWILDWGTIFPFEELNGGSREVGLIVGVLIGIGFGFVLERAGFGRATKLAAQFYLRDLTVFKVMFSAIVTAMLGLVGAAGLGMVDLRAASESIASWTYIWPMLAGGFVLGAGFIISGYCPGTSLVSSASGNIDGMFAFAGVVTGTLLYPVTRFHESGEKGAWFLYDLLKVRPEILAVGIAVMAVGAFIGAEKIEHGGVRSIFRIATPAFATLAAVALITLVIPNPAVGEEPGEAQTIAAADIATAAVAEPWRYSIEGNKVTDAATGRTMTILGEYKPLSPSVAAAPAKAGALSGKPIPKPKKKGGGCSS
jgi:hypothetical protein